MPFTPGKRAAWWICPDHWEHLYYQQKLCSTIPCGHQWRAHAWGTQKKEAQTLSHQCHLEHCTVGCTYVNRGALRILGPLDSIFTRALLCSGWVGWGGGGGVYIIEIAIAFPSQSFFPLLPNQIILFQLLKSFSFVCNGKVIIFRFGFL